MEGNSMLVDCSLNLLESRYDLLSSNVIEPFANENLLSSTNWFCQRGDIMHLPYIFQPEYSEDVVNVISKAKCEVKCRILYYQLVPVVFLRKNGRK